MNADLLIFQVLNEARKLSPEALRAFARKALESDHPGERAVFAEKLKSMGHDPHAILGIKKPSGSPSAPRQPHPRPSSKWAGRAINPWSKDFRDRLHSKNEGNLTPDLINYPGFHNLYFRNNRAISIQASEFHHSTPKIDGLHPHQYTHWEVEILDGLHFQDEFKKKFGLQVKDRGENSKPKYSWTALNVPTEDVQRMVDHIEKMPVVGQQFY